MASLTLSELGDSIAAAHGDAVTQVTVALDELTIHVPAGSLLAVMRYLRDDASCAFKQISDITGVDWPERDPRFEVVYHLLSLSNNRRIRVKVLVNDGDVVPSVTGLWNGAGWFERETWDMFGIFFDGHPDLRRILTDYGFEGHPLRKDFPLTGYVEMRYDTEQGRVVYEPVKLTQDFRSFDFLSPWEGMTDVQLPGTEKLTPQALENKS